MNELDTLLLRLSNLVEVIRDWPIDTNNSDRYLVAAYLSSVEEMLAAVDATSLQAAASRAIALAKMLEL